MLSLWMAVGILSNEASFVLIPIAMLVLRKRERYGEIFLGFFFILILSDSRQNSLDFAVLLKNIYVVLMAVILFLDRNKFQPFSPLIKGFVPFFIIAILTLLKAPSDEVSVSIQKTLSYALVMLAAPNYLTLAYRQNGEKFLKNLVWLGALILLTGIVLRYAGFEFVYVKGRFAGIFGNPNGLGIFCLMFWIFSSIVHSRFKGLFTRNQIYTVFGIIGLALILSGSRSSLFALLIFLVFSRLYKISSAFGFISLILVVIGYELISLNLNTIVTAVGLEEYFRLETLETGSGRLVAWSFAWEHIQFNFFLGRGFAHTENLYIKYQEILRALGHEGHAHNVYLTFWLNTGLIGLLCFFVLGLFPLFFRAAKLSNLSMPMLYGAMFSMNFESWLTASLNPFTILLWMSLTVLTNPYFIESSDKWIARQKEEEEEEASNEINPNTKPLLVR